MSRRAALEEVIVVPANNVEDSPPFTITATDSNWRDCSQGCHSSSEVATFLGAFGGVALFVVAMAMLTALACVCRRKKKKTPSTPLVSVVSEVFPQTVQHTEPQNRSLPNPVYDGHFSIELLQPFVGRISSSHLRDLSTIGEGSFGVVKRGKLDLPTEPHDLQVAVKLSRNSALESEDHQSLINEINLLANMKPHRNVVLLIGYSVRFSPVLLILEYCPNGDLRAYLHNLRRTLLTGNPVEKSSIQNKLAKRLLSFASQIADGMSHLARCDFIHRDLATRNILLTADMMIKISDFGLARRTTSVYQKLTSGRVPWKWMAPESLNPLLTIYSTKTDVWSFGIVLFELFSLGGDPYPDMLSPSDLERFLSGGHRMLCPADCPTEVYSVMLRCWTSEPESRPPFRVLADELTVLFDKEADYLCFDFPQKNHGHNENTGSCGDVSDEGTDVTGDSVLQKAGHV